MRIILLLFLIFPFFGTAQNVDLQEVERQLMQLTNTLLADTIQKNRVVAAEKMDTLLQNALVAPGAFDYPFDSITGFSILQPEDKSFRIFTWQLYVDVNEYQYYGVIQLPGDTPMVIPLKDKSEDLVSEDLPYEILDKSNWYGALYYNIKAYDSPQGKRYLLFGFDGYRLYHKRKLVEVLYFEQGEPVFGDAAFFPTEADRPDLALNRFMLTYGAVTSIRLNYDDYLGKIIFDHLLEGRGMLDGEMSFLPDGSYKGYVLKDGRWVLVDKIFDHTYDSAPRPQPVLGGKKQKDVFGN